MGEAAISDEVESRPEQTNPGERNGLLAWIDRHPTATAAAIAALLGLAHLLWIRSHRMPGLLDVDEAGYLSGAWRFREALEQRGPDALFHELANTGTAPVVPLLSAGLLVLGPDEVWWAMTVQPLLLVLTAASVAALADRLVPGRTAVLAGAAFCALPTVIVATQSYWYGLAVAAFLGLSLWALLASQQCRGPTIWWLAPLLAGMILSRTMALGFVPAVVGAGIAVAWGDRRGLLRLAGSVIGAGLLAAPWYLATYDSTLRYLVFAGYSAEAGQFGTDSPLLQVAAVPAELMLDSGFVPAFAVLVAGWVVFRRNRSDGMGVIRRVWASPERRALTIAAALGAVALMSTANRGGFFGLPLLVPLTALSAEVVHRAGPTVARITTGILILQGSLVLVAGWWILPYGAPIPMSTLYETTFRDVDVRFDPATREHQPGAATEWSAAYDRTVDAVNDLATGPNPVTVITGNMALFNGNQLELAARLRGEPTIVRVPDTTAPNLGEDTLRTPPPGGQDSAPVLVVVEHDRERFYDDVRSEEFTTRAEQLGWTTARRIPLPNGDQVRILLPPGASASG